jgi:hypothetical protein
VFLQVATRGTYIKVKNALVDGAAKIEHIQPIASYQIMGQIGYQHTFGKKKKLESFVLLNNNFHLQVTSLRS